MDPITQSRIPGQDYGITGWTVQKLRQWILTNFSTLIPQSIQAGNVTATTVNVQGTITLSAAGVRDLKNQLGLP